MTADAKVYEDSWLFYTEVTPKLGPAVRNIVTARTKLLNRLPMKIGRTFQKVVHATRMTAPMTATNIH
jgi:hypothetical protein